MINNIYDLPVTKSMTPRAMPTEQGAPVVPADVQRAFAETCLGSHPALVATQKEIAAASENNLLGLRDLLVFVSGVSCLIRADWTALDSDEQATQIAYGDALGLLVDAIEKQMIGIADLHIDDALRVRPHLDALQAAGRRLAANRYADQGIEQRALCRYAVRAAKRELNQWFAELAERLDAPLPPLTTN